MDRFLRIYTLHRALTAHRYPLSLEGIRERLEDCSESTAKRTIEVMRDHLGAPIVYDRLHNGYRYDVREGEHPYELPGLWFNASELHALLAAHTLLEQVQPGLLGDTLAPLRGRIEQILAQEQAAGPATLSRIRILGMGLRDAGEYFQTVAGALLQRRRLPIRYHARGNDSVSERTVSPQRLSHYRDNWYLDAWCHAKQGLRSFAVDRILEARMSPQTAVEIDEGELDGHYASAYGIFAGPAPHTAVLRFSAERARWVADEQWHPEQQGRMLSDGRYELRLPYGDPRELIMDILKYGPDVEVRGPPELRRAVRDRLQHALEHYS